MAQAFRPGKHSLSLPLSPCFLWAPLALWISFHTQSVWKTRSVPGFGPHPCPCPLSAMVLEAGLQDPPGPGRAGLFHWSEKRLCSVCVASSQRAGTGRSLGLRLAFLPLGLSGTVSPSLQSSGEGLGPAPGTGSPLTQGRRLHMAGAAGPAGCCCSKWQPLRAHLSLALQHRALLVLLQGQGIPCLPRGKASSRCSNPVG